jgi:FO synthase
LAELHARHRHLQEVILQNFVPHQSYYGREPARIADVPRAVERARDGQRLTGEELTALFAERRPAVIEEIRSAADELRARLAGETVTFVVNRNINISNVCVVGCAF